MSFDLVWEPRGVYKRFSGKVSFPEYARSQELVLADPRTDSIRYVINDLLAIESYSITTEQAEYAAAFNRAPSKTNPHIRVAYVTTDLKLIGLIKLVAMISSYDLKVFATLAQARVWCNNAGSGS